jgi:hypothetical protein
MKKLISVLLISTVLLSVGLSARAEDAIVKPGLTPDSPFYFLDNIGESIGMFFAFSEEAKAKKALTYAEEKLAEAEATVENEEEVGKARERYEQYMERVRARVEENKNKEGEELSDEVASRITKHFDVLDRIIEKAPEKAKEALIVAKENSSKGYERVLEVLSEKSPERAIEINDDLLKRRLSQAKQWAKENKEESEEVIKDYERFQKLFDNLGEQEDLRERIEEKAAEHIKGLYELELNSEGLSEEAMERITEIKEKVQDRLEKSLDKIGEINPEKAAEINFRAIENRLEFMKENIGDNSDKAERYIKEFQERNQIREKISEGIENKEGLSEEFKTFFESKVRSNEGALKNLIEKVPAQVQTRIREVIEEGEVHKDKIINLLEQKRIRTQNQTPSTEGVKRAPTSVTNVNSVSATQTKATSTNIKSVNINSAVKAIKNAAGKMVPELAPTE